MDKDIEILNQNNNESDSDSDGSVLTIDKIEVKRPRKYQVLLHNDDYTTMEFVIYILQNIFGKTMDQAEQIMLKVHHDGAGICAIYTYEVAETKSVKVVQLAKDNGYPLKCTFEPES